MKNKKILLLAIHSIFLVFSLILTASVAEASVTAHPPDGTSIHSAVDSTSAASEAVLNAPQGQVISMVAAGGYHTVGLKADGTVVAVGYNTSGQCGIGSWTGIVQVAAGGYHTVGLKDDGTVVAVGDNQYGQCEVGNWTDIIQVAAGCGHTVGLKSDGTVIAVGNNEVGQCGVGGWVGIVKIAAGFFHTVGLRTGGTVVAVGRSDYGQCNVGVWTDIIQISAGYSHTVGLRADGTVLAAGLEVELVKWNLGSAALYLTISSTTGGEVTRPGEGTFPYYPGRMLNLVAKPGDGYRFIKWTGDVGTIANVNAAQTTITMSGNYSITANFEERSPVNWALIGGIIAVVVVGLAIFFMRRRRAASTKRR